jgi:hypothetical protein
MKTYFYTLCYFIFLQLGASIQYRPNLSIPKLFTTIQRTPKLCTHCKFYVNSFNRNEFAKCSLFILKNIWIQILL